MRVFIMKKMIVSGLFGFLWINHQVHAQSPVDYQPCPGNVTSTLEINSKAIQIKCTEGPDRSPGIPDDKFPTIMVKKINEPGLIDHIGELKNDQITGLKIFNTEPQKVDLKFDEKEMFGQLTALKTLELDNVQLESKSGFKLIVPNTLEKLVIVQGGLKDLDIKTLDDTFPTKLTNVTITDMFNSAPTFLLMMKDFSKDLVINLRFSKFGPITVSDPTDFQQIWTNWEKTKHEDSQLTFQEECPSGGRSRRTLEETPTSSPLPAADSRTSLPIPKSFIKSNKDSTVICLDESQEEGNGGDDVAKKENKSRDSSGNPALVIILIAVGLFGVALAAVIYKRFLSTPTKLIRRRRARRDPNRGDNDHTIGLLGKDELTRPRTGTAVAIRTSMLATSDGRGTFFGKEDPLSKIRLAIQDIQVHKVLGGSTDPHTRLWLGEYQGKKVALRKAEAEVNDLYATKELVDQTRRLCVLPQHPNVTSILGVIWQGTTGDFSVVTEHMDKGNLKSILMDEDQTNAMDQMNTKLNMCLDIAEALVYLKTNQLYAKKLSSRKVLVNSSLVCKLNVFECDGDDEQKDIFFLSKHVVESFGTGDSVWFAPELLLLGTSNTTTTKAIVNMEKANMYSFGVLMGEIMTRMSPYQSLIQEKGNTLVDLQIVKEFRQKKQTQVPPHENHPLFQEAPMIFQVLVQKCLSFDPSSRPTAEEVVSTLKLAKAQSMNHHRSNNNNNSSSSSSSSSSTTNTTNTTNTTITKQQQQDIV